MDSDRIEEHCLQPDAVIRFRNVSVFKPNNKPWWKRNEAASLLNTHLLRNVSGSISCGDFVAVIGPSGSGKTTFLSVLAGKCTLPFEGEVLLNDTDVRKVRSGIIEIVPQYETFVESLSVLEHLHFMIEIKLGSSTRFTKKDILHKLLKQLKLETHANTVIGDLSGGERRLLSLTSSLISKPKVVICDEPTTGLDSFNATLVVSVLKSLVNDDNIVICSVHQPSADLFKEFNSVLLLTEGRLVFYGSQDNCKEVFERLQLTCPQHYNSAEFYVNAIISKCDSSTSVSNVDRIAEYYERQYQNKGFKKNYYNFSSLEYAGCRVSQRNWFMQIFLLVWRSSLTIKRNKIRHFIELLNGVIITALVFGFCYFGVTGTTQAGIQDMRGLLWLLISDLAFGVGYTSVTAIEIDMSLFKREYGMYSSSAYFVSRLIGLIPKCVIWPVSYVIILFLIVEIPNKFVTGTQIVLVLFATCMAAAAYGLSLSALFSSSRLSTEVMPCTDTILVLTSGTFLRLSSLPFWLAGFKYISHFYYGMEAISNIYWKEIDKIDCTWNSTKCIKDGIEVLRENGYDENYKLQDSFGFIVIIIGWSLVGYYGLWRERRKGYAY